MFDDSAPRATQHWSEPYEMIGEIAGDGGKCAKQATAGGDHSAPTVLMLRAHSSHDDDGGGLP